MKILIILLLVIPVISFSSLAESDTMPANFKSPEDISQWLSKEFSYEWQIPTPWQSVDETMNSKRGSCLDFAILSQSLLAKIGTHCDIAIVKFKDLDIAHAICLWKSGGGYNFMSNAEYVNTNMPSIEEAVSQNYPDWDEIVFTSPDKQYGRTIKRRYGK